MPMTLDYAIPSPEPAPAWPRSPTTVQSCFGRWNCGRPHARPRRRRAPTRVAPGWSGPGCGTTTWPRSWSDPPVRRGDDHRRGRRVRCRRRIPSPAGAPRLGHRPGADAWHWVGDHDEAAALAAGRGSGHSSPSAGSRWEDPPARWL